MNGGEKVDVGKHKKESVSLSMCDLIQFKEREFKYIHCYKAAERETQSFWKAIQNLENANMFKSAKKYIY